MQYFFCFIIFNYKKDLAIIALIIVISLLDCYNEGISVAGFCCQVAAWFPDLFCYFYFLKNPKIVKNSTATKAREKISTDLESLEFFMYV